MNGVHVYCSNTLLESDCCVSCACYHGRASHLVICIDALCVQKDLHRIGKR